MIIMALFTGTILFPSSGCFISGIKLVWHSFAEACIYILFSMLFPGLMAQFIISLPMCFVELRHILTEIPPVTSLLKHIYVPLPWRPGKDEVSTPYLPREFIRALKLSTFGQASRKSSGRDRMWFLLRFKIFSSFRLKGEQIPDILFLVVKHKTED